MRPLTLLIFVALLATPVLADCLTPFDDMEIARSGTICQGTHLAQGISITESDVVLVCDYARFLGEETGHGLVIRDAENVTVLGCVFERYESGVYAENVSGLELKDNVFRSNKFGITLIDSPDPVRENNLFDNNSRQDIYRFSSPSIPRPPEEEPRRESVSLPWDLIEKDMELQRPDLTKDERRSLARELVEDYALSSEQELGISHDVSSNRSKTLVTITLDPKVPIDNLSVYHRIPKCAASYIDQVFFIDKRLTVLEEDPAVKWWIFRIVEPKTLRYEIFGELEQGCEEQLYTFALGEPEEPEPVQTELVEERKPNYALYATAAVIMLAISALLWLRKRR